MDERLKSHHSKVEKVKDFILTPNKSMIIERPLSTIEDFSLSENEPRTSDSSAPSTPERSPNGGAKRDDAFPTTFSLLPPPPPPVASPSRVAARLKRATAHREAALQRRRNAQKTQTEAALAKAESKRASVLAKRAGRARKELERVERVRRRVKACKMIQRSFRNQCDHCSSPSSPPDLNPSIDSERARLVIQRFFSNTVLKVQKISPSGLQTFTRSLETVVGSFTDGGLSFEELTMKMQSEEMTSAAEAVSGVLDLFAATSTGGARQLLSCFLIGTHPSDVVGDDEDPSPSALPTNRLKRLVRQTAANTFKSCRDFLQSSRVGHDGEESYAYATPPLHMLDDLLRRYLGFLTVFTEWRKMDRVDMLANMEKSATNSWGIFLESCLWLKTLKGIARESDSAREQVMLHHEHARKGAGNHLKRLRSAVTKLDGADSAHSFMCRTKKAAAALIDEEATIEHINSTYDKPREPSKVGDEPSVKNVRHVTPKEARKIAQNASMVHRVMLTPSHKLRDLTISGEPRIETPSFEAFVGANRAADGEGDSGESFEARVEKAMKQAFWAGIIESMEEGDFANFMAVYQELKSSINGLVRRVDLQNFFDDEVEMSKMTLAECANLLVTAGSVLMNLESVTRSPSTESLIEMIRADSAPSATFVCDALSFLLFKVELCQMDIADAKFVESSYFLKANGLDKERSDFLKAHSEDDATTFETLDLSSTPATNEFVAEGRSIAPPGTSPEITLKVYCTVTSLLFSRDPRPLPEIYSLDARQFQEAREVATVAACGNAIATTICSMARINVNNIDLSDVANANVSRAHDMLILALTGQDNSEGGVSMESIVDASIALYNAVKSTRSDDTCDRDVITRKVSAILDGSDAVVKLFHSRIQNFFRLIAEKKIPRGNVPAKMVSGLMQKGRNGAESSLDADQDCEQYDQMVSYMTSCARSLGFGFFADELAEEGMRFKGIVDHMWDCYGEEFLSKRYF